MTDKKTEALKLALESAAGLALEVLKKHRQMKGEYPMGMLGVRAVEKLEAVFSEMDEALAEQPAQPQTCHSKTGKSETQSSLMLTDETQAQQQEPVAWMDADGDLYKDEPKENWCPPHTQLYTFPQPSKPWVGLTEEDIEAAMPGGIYDCLADPWDCGVGDGDYMRSIKNDVVRIVRAIEAKLREKNT